MDAPLNWRRRLGKNWPLLLVLLFGTALRLWNISDPYILDFHAWRQSDTAAFTHNYLVDTLNPLDPAIDRYKCEHRALKFGRVEAELPVASWLAALPLRALGITCPTAPYLRGVSILFFLGTAIYLFLLVRRLSSSPAVAVLSVLSFSVLPLSIFFTRTIQPESPSLFFSVAFLYHLLLWLERNKQLHGALSAAFAALCFLQKIYSAFLFFPAIYLIIAHKGVWGSLKGVRFWIWGVAILLPVAAWYYHSHGAPWSFGIWGGSGKYASMELITAPKFWKVFSERVLFEILGWSGLILLVAGMTFFRGSRALHLAAVWLASLFLIMTLTIPANSTHVYYQLPFVLPAAVCIGYGLLGAWRGGWIGKLALGGLLAIHLATCWHQLPHYYRNDQRILDAIELIKRHVPAGETIVSTDRNPAMFTNSCHRAYFPANIRVQTLESCMGKEISYLLVEARALGAIHRNAPEWIKLTRSFKELQRTRFFSIWRRR